MKREEALKNARMFAELGNSDLKRLAKLMAEMQFAAGSVVIKEGDLQRVVRSRDSILRKSRVIQDGRYVATGGS